MPFRDRVEPLPVINDLDEPPDPLLRLGKGLVLADMHLLLLQGLDETLHHGVVVRIALGRHARTETGLLQCPDIFTGGVLHSAIGVVDTAGRGPASSLRFLERLSER